MKTHFNFGQIQSTTSPLLNPLLPASLIMEQHNQAVARIAEQVARFAAEKKQFRIYHGSTNSTRPSERRQDNTIDTSQLTKILRVDKDRKIALCEPNVPMDRLVEETLKYGLVPPVVMEFPGITVGGGFSGTSGESSSFRYGAFDSIVSSIEIVLATGTVEKASKLDKKDLFWGAASAFGTLGVVTLLEVELREAKPYIALTYTLANGVEESVKMIQDECAIATVDYVDAIAFSPDLTVICSGTMADELPSGKHPATFTSASDPWFYLRAQDAAKELAADTSQKPVVDYIPIFDYLFRYDRGGFWTGKSAFEYFGAPYNNFTRRLLDRYMHARIMYHAAHKSGIADRAIVQDVGVPFDRAVEFQNWLDATFNIYPLWLCPLRLQRDDPAACHGLHAEFAVLNTPGLLNYGVWGPFKETSRENMEKNRVLEAKVQELKGKKWLYSHAYYTEQEFWANYDRESYDKLREKYGATHLKSVFDKVAIDFEAQEAAARATPWKKVKHAIGEIWPVRGLYGVYKATAGGDYLLQKKSGTH